MFVGRQTRRRAWKERTERDVRDTSADASDGFGAIFHCSSVDEGLYRNLTDDIIGDLTSQSYGKKRRSYDQVNW